MGGPHHQSLVIKLNYIEFIFSKYPLNLVEVSMLALSFFPSYPSAHIREILLNLFFLFHFVLFLPFFIKLKLFLFFFIFLKQNPSDLAKIQMPGYLNDRILNFLKRNSIREINMSLVVSSSSFPLIIHQFALAFNFFHKLSLKSCHF